VSSSSDEDTDSTESDRKYDSEWDSDVDMRLEDDVDAPDGVDLDGDVNMEIDGEDEEDEAEEDEKEEKEVDEEEDEDQDNDNGKEPRTIGQGEMVHTSAGDADTMVDNQPTVLPEQGQEMRKHTPRPQPPAPAPWPQTPEARPRPRTPETHTLSGPEFLGLLMPRTPLPAAPTLREAEAAGNTSDVDVDQQLLGKSKGGDSLPDVLLPDVPLPDAPHPDVSHPDVPLPEVRPDGSEGEEWTRPRVVEEACVRVKVGFLSCEFPLLESIHLRHWLRHTWSCFVCLG